MEGNKRKSAAMDYDEDSYDEPATEQVKRPRTDRKLKQSSQARVDPTYGQRSAFPGLDSYSAYTEDDDDDLEYGDDIEALQYLQAVRNEAAGIPTLLVAPKPDRDYRNSSDRSIYEDGTGDSRGFYLEGAYVGAFTTSDDSESSSQEAQTAYFKSLLHRFHKLHDQLSTAPPQMVVEGLSSNHPSYMSNSREDLRSWRWRLFNTDPQPAQLAIMDKSTVFKLLRLILTNNGALGGKTPISSRLSRWIWGLLAKVPVSGELMSEEVGLIREIGKRAVWLGVEMRGVNIRELYKDEAENDDNDDVVVEFDVDDGKDADSELACGEARIIGPILPSVKDATLKCELVGEVEADGEKGVPSPIVFSSRAEAIRSQQMNSSTRKVSTTDEEEGEAKEYEEGERIAAMKERLLASLEEATEPNTGVVEDPAQEAPQAKDYQSDLENAKITVDMIITIAGEVYGQRDLLEFRSEWD